MDKVHHNYTFRLRKSCRMAAYNQLKNRARASKLLEPRRVDRALGLCQSGNIWQRCWKYGTTFDTCQCKDRRPVRYKERVTLCKHITGKWLERLAVSYERKRGSDLQRAYASVRVITDPNLAHKLDQDYQD